MAAEANTLCKEGWRSTARHCNVFDAYGGNSAVSLPQFRLQCNHSFLQRFLVCSKQVGFVCFWEPQQLFEQEDPADEFALFTPLFSSFFTTLLQSGEFTDLLTFFSPLDQQSICERSGFELGGKDAGECLLVLLVVDVLVHSHDVHLNRLDPLLEPGSRQCPAD